MPFLSSGLPREERVVLLLRQVVLPLVGEGLGVAVVPALHLPSPRGPVEPLVGQGEPVIRDLRVAGAVVRVRGEGPVDVAVAEEAEEPAGHDGDGDDPQEREDVLPEGVGECALLRLEGDAGLFLVARRDPDPLPRDPPRQRRDLLRGGAPEEQGDERREVRSARRALADEVLHGDLQVARQRLEGLLQPGELLGGELDLARPPFRRRPARVLLGRAARAGSRGLCLRGAGGRRRTELFCGFRQAELVEVAKAFLPQRVQLGSAPASRPVPALRAPPRLPQRAFRGRAGSRSNPCLGEAPPKGRQAPRIRFWRRLGRFGWGLG